MNAEEPIAEEALDRVLLAGGGYQNLKKLVQFGREHLDQASKEAFDEALNQALDGGDITAFETYVSDLREFYAKAGYEDKPPEPERASSLVRAEEDMPQPESGLTQAAEPFSDQTEMIRAIQDPRYRKDPVFQAKTEARIAATEHFNPQG
ncbi:hypothetical protein DDZ18_08845 [Marinicauda salina]|uniref:Uncharacterized protein n=1 Tax=Marinicauda salina TaxID=2135793 RepID=A0A2U2BUP4_9PROT|nr:hypothetical protein [Marinicauda salina]PWE17751.1 hypothetical protein DDZ18_08845 [Marinicauda salina]